MPGNVANADPTVIMPWSLCLAFRESRTFPCAENVYKNGESQRRALTVTSRKVFEIQYRLTAVALDALRTFYAANLNTAFLFYDVWHTAPKFSYDVTGAAPSGRYTVRFDGEWSESLEFPRCGLGLRLIEVA